jgi:integrase
MTIGAWPVLTLKQARTRTKKVLVDVTDGSDPAAERRRKRTQATFNQLCEGFLSDYSKIHKRSWRDDELTIKKYMVRRWGRRQAVTITSQDVRRLHREIGKLHPYAANRTIALIRSMYQQGSTKTQWNAADEGYVPPGHPNPATTVKLYRESPRDRWLSSTELHTLLLAIDQEESPYVRAIFQLLLYTGCRKSELLGLPWENVSFEEKVLTLIDTKSANSHRVPLMPDAINVFSSLIRIDSNPFVFPGRIPGTHLKNIDKAFHRIRERAGLSNVRIHDLRRTFGSNTVQKTGSLHLVGKALNHKSQSATAVYAHFADDNLKIPFEINEEIIRNARLGDNGVPLDPQTSFNRKK